MGYRWEEVTGEWKFAYKRHDLYTSPDINVITSKKSRHWRRMWHVREIANGSSGFGGKNLMERVHLADLDRDGEYLIGLLKRNLHGSKQEKEADSCDRGKELLGSPGMQRIY